MAHKFKQEWVAEREQPRRELNYLIIPRQGAHFSPEFHFRCGYWDIPCARPGFEYHPVPRLHDVHRDEYIIENGVCGHRREQLFACGVEGACDSYDRPRSRLQRADLFFNLPVEA